MNTDNQTLIILFLGIALILSLYLGNNQFTEFILGIFGGIFMQKTMTEKQEETWKQYHIQQYEDTIGSGDDVQ
jgi:hypothetical protein